MADRQGFPQIAAPSIRDPERGTQTLRIGAARLTAGEVAAAARGRHAVALDEAAWTRIAAGFETLTRLAASEGAIYGVNTGLGAVADTRIAPGTDDVQRRVILARMVGVGPVASPEQVRAVMIARLAGIAEGRAGISPVCARAYLDLLNSGVTPAMPLVGSVGEADLAPLAHVAGVLVGAGAALVDGRLVPGAVALAAAGLQPPRLGPKDGLALVSSNAASVGLGALVVADADQLFDAWIAAGALSLEAYRANVDPLRPESVALRPAPCQAEIGAALLARLTGGELMQPGAARKLQDPLGFRCLGPVLAAWLDALRAAEAATELELNSTDDNPAILAEAGRVQPNANFDPTHLVLAFEQLGLATARVAAAQGQRILKLMSAESSGLPRFLSPIQAGRTGFAALQKTVGALVVEIGQNAIPMPALVLPAADGVEDYGTMAVPVMRKSAVLIEQARMLAAIELLVAAQACDLREGLRLAPATAAIHARVRGAVAKLEEDRPSAPDITTLDALIRAGTFDAPSPGAA